MTAGTSQKKATTLYPLHPRDSKVLLRFPEHSVVSCDDWLIVAFTSLVVVGSAVWVPSFYIFLFRRWKQIPKVERRRKAIYSALIAASLVVLLWKPHASPRIGQWLKIRKWKCWESWMRYFALEVIQDQPNRQHKSSSKLDSVVYAVSPHGIFPFALAFAVLPEIVAERAFGLLRPVVATATNYLPIVNDFLLWLGKVDASKDSVDNALAGGGRLGLAPGGIAEMFEGYPKQGTNPNGEYVIVRNGVLKIAMKHHVPVVPVYCFGSTKLLHRISFSFWERLSTMLRASIVLFYGRFGLPIPFRQKLSYVIGYPVYPPTTQNNESDVVETMMDELCQELHRIFDRHKEAYGWGQKSLHLIRR